MSERPTLAQLPSPDEWNEEEDRLGFFGPGSVTWRIHTDPSYAVGGLRVHGRSGGGSATRQLKRTPSLL